MNIRFLIPFLCCLFILSHSVAQRQYVYFFNSGKKVSTADSADYTIIVSGPSSGSKLYDVKEYYKNGQPALIGKTSSIDPIVLEGYCLYYYPNGKKMRYVNYNMGRLDGDDYRYFPNGAVYSFIKNKLISGDAHRYTYFPLIIASDDSTGKKLVIDGNGHFIEYYGDYKKFTEEGEVKAGKKDGVWKRAIYGIPSDSLIDLDTYSEGKLISSKSTDPNKVKKMPQYSSALKGPQFKGGQKAFNIYLARNIRYPYNARKNNIHGKVIVQFIVERDGSLTEVKVLQSPNDDLSAEAIRVVKNSPKWAPVRQNGLTVRDKYTIPVKFALNGSK